MKPSKIVTVLLFGFVACLGCGSRAPRRPNIDLDNPLPAAAQCEAGRVVISNRGTDVWTDVRIEVNHEYSHQTAAIAAGDTMRFFPSIFTKDDGTRLNLEIVACKTIDVHATVGGVRRSWNGSTPQ